MAHLCAQVEGLQQGVDVLRAKLLAVDLIMAVGEVFWSPELILQHAWPHSVSGGRQASSSSDVRLHRLKGLEWPIVSLSAISEPGYVPLLQS